MKLESHQFIGPLKYCKACLRTLREHEGQAPPINDTLAASADAIARMERIAGFDPRWEAMKAQGDWESQR